MRFIFIVGDSMKNQVNLIIFLLISNSLYAGQAGLKNIVPSKTPTNSGHIGIKVPGQGQPVYNVPSTAYQTSPLAYNQQAPSAAVKLVTLQQRNISNQAQGRKPSFSYKPIIQNKGVYQAPSWWKNRLTGMWNYFARAWNQFFNKDVIVAENQAVFNEIITALGKANARDEIRDIFDMHPNFLIDELYTDKKDPSKKMRVIDVLVVASSKNSQLLPILKYIVTKKGASVNGRIAVDKEEQLTPLGMALVLLTTRNKQEYPGAYAVFELLLETGARTNELVIVSNKGLSLVEFAQMIGLPQNIIEELKKERTVTAPTSKSFKKFLDTFDPHTKTYGSITITKKIKQTEEEPLPKDHDKIREQRAQEIFNELENAIMTNDLNKVQNILAYTPGFKINKSYQADTVGHKIRLIDVAAYKAIEDFDKMPDGLAMMKLLIKKGVDLSANFKTEETAFLKLCLQGIKHKKPGAIPVLNFFIESGIHINMPITTHNGKITPLKYALEHHFPEDVINMLKNAGATEQ